ncbi:unnamed protein product, partial [Meganyctiphanes norvegica]
MSIIVDIIDILLFKVGNSASDHGGSPPLPPLSKMEECSVKLSALAGEQTYIPIITSGSFKTLIAIHNQHTANFMRTTIMDIEESHNHSEADTSAIMKEEEDHLSTFDSPKRGPTLSTSTSSFEALDPHDPNLSHLATTMFSHTSNYLKGELSAVLEDYTLLEQMNRATITKYADMHQIAGSVSRSAKDLNEKYIALQPYLDQIDQIEDSVTKLEAAAYKLDAYSKRLEAKFKSIEKK